VPDGPIKTFPLRGIKDSPPYLHDGRLLTLDDTVEFFNVVLGAKLSQQEKQDLVQFLRALKATADLTRPLRVRGL
jgi:cytochrome c peroxidase